MENETKNNKKSCTHSISRGLLRSIVIFIIVIATCINIVGSLFWFSMYRIEQRKKEVPVFLHQIIVSVHNNTDYYKEHSAQSVLRDYEELKNNADKMVGPNDIIITDYDLGMYECKIIFDNKAVFKADVSFIDGLPILHHFAPVWQRNSSAF